MFEWINEWREWRYFELCWQTSEWDENRMSYNACCHAGVYLLSTSTWIRMTGGIFSLHHHQYTLWGCSVISTFFAARIYGLLSCLSASLLACSLFRSIVWLLACFVLSMIETSNDNNIDGAWWLLLMTMRYAQCTLTHIHEHNQNQIELFIICIRIRNNLHNILFDWTWFSCYSAGNICKSERKKKRKTDRGRPIEESKKCEDDSENKHIACNRYWNEMYGVMRGIAAKMSLCSSKHALSRAEQSNATYMLIWYNHPYSERRSSVWHEMKQWFDATTQNLVCWVECLSLSAATRLFASRIQITLRAYQWL